MVARWVLGRVLPFAVWEVRWFHCDGRAAGPRALAVCIDVGHAHHHRVRHLATTRWSTVIPHVTENESTVAEAQLRAVVLADPYTLDKPEGIAKPISRFAYVRIDEDRDDSGRRDRSVRVHAASLRDAREEPLVLCRPSRML